MVDDRNIVRTEKTNITIDDVARSLGISKTTVSRAISGKGRIGESTRRRVLDFIEENNYTPSPMARGLAESKTYNIGWVYPGDSGLTDLPFFQRCMGGIADVAAAENYDILVSMVYYDDISHLKRVVNNRKVDGIILGRTLMNDSSIAFLKDSGIPFVVIGSTEEEGVKQVDNDHVNACRELTSILIMKGFRKLALIGGTFGLVANRTRYDGFMAALKEQGLKARDKLIYIDNKDENDIRLSAGDAVAKGADCLVCMDDRMCLASLSRLKDEGLRIPEDIGVASFYDSELLNNNIPAITAIRYDPRELGVVACRKLFSMLRQENVPEKTMLGYEVQFKGSTRKITR